MPSVAVERILFDFGEQGASALNKQIGAVIDNLEHMAIKASILSGIVLAMSEHLVKFGIDFMEVGAKVSIANQVFEISAQKIGTVGSELLPRLQEATLGTISKFELMRNANFALESGLKLTESQLVHMAEAATKLGIAVGKEPSEAFKIMTEAITKGSERMLAQIGVIVDSRTAFRELAEAQGEHVNHLTRSQKIAEVFKITMEESNRRLAELGSVSFESATAGERLSAAFKNFRDHMAELFVQSGAAEKFFGAVNGALERLMAHFNEPGVAERFFDGIVRGALALLDVALKILSVLERLAPYLDTIIKTFVGAQIGGALGDTVGSFFEGIPIIGPIIKGAFSSGGRLLGAGMFGFSSGELEKAGAEIGESVNQNTKPMSGTVHDLVRGFNNQMIEPSFPPVGY